MTNHRGGVLPIVLLVLASAVLLGGATLDRAWSLERAGRNGAHREGVAVSRLGAAARVLRRGVPRGALLTAPPGAGPVESADGMPAAVARWWRTHPLVGGVDVHPVAGMATAELAGGLRHLVWIAPPPWPIVWDQGLGVRTIPDGSNWLRRMAPLRPRCHRLSRTPAGDHDYPAGRCLIVDPTNAPLQLRVEGLVVVDGAMVVTGDWEVTGLLIGLGSIRVAGGRLLVQGGAVGDPEPTVWSVPGLHLRPDPAAVDRALALAGRPTRAPFHLWQRLP